MDSRRVKTAPGQKRDASGSGGYGRCHPRMGGHTRIRRKARLRQLPRHLLFGAAVERNHALNKDGKSSGLALMWLGMGVRLSRSCSPTKPPSCRRPSLTKRSSPITMRCRRSNSSDQAVRVPPRRSPAQRCMRSCGGRSPQSRNSTLSLSAAGTPPFAREDRAARH